MTLTLPEAHPMPTPPQRRRFHIARGRQAKPAPHAEQARRYAEEYYQALRRWHVELAQASVPIISYDAFRPEPEISTLGELLPSRPSMLQLPDGQHYETDVAEAISVMSASRGQDRRAAGILLDRLRSPHVRTPATLLRENGQWQPDAPRHAAWAVACLTLGVLLRDKQAERFLPYCRRAMEGREVAT